MTKVLPKNATVLIVNALGDEARVTSQHTRFSCKLKPAEGVESERQVTKETLENFLTSLLLCEHVG